MEGITNPICIKKKEKTSILKNKKINSEEIFNENISYTNPENLYSKDSCKNKFIVFNEDNLDDQIKLPTKINNPKADSLNK